MPRLAVTLVVMVALVALAGCTSPGGEGAGPSSGTPQATELGEHLLVHVNGRLGYKNPGWKEYLPLSFGRALRRGTLLQVADDAAGLVVCSNLSLAPLPAGYEGGLPCSEEQPVLVRGESLVLAPQRGAGETAALPYVLSPRHSFVETAAPLLRWQAGADSSGPYTVRVWGSGLDWTGSAESSELIYPADAPPLQPGVPYRLTVQDAAGNSSDQEATALDLGFVLLPPEEIASVRETIAEVQGLEVDDPSRRLLEAEVLASYDLRADAIAALEELAPSVDAPTVWQRLGDLYREVGLYAEARSAYDSALTGFRSLGDGAGEAATLAGLGLAQRGDNDPAGARASLTQAEQAYQAIGDADGARQVADILEELGP